MLAHLTKKDSPMKATKKSYPIDFNDSQWELLKALISSAGKGSKKRITEPLHLYHSHPSIKNSRIN